MVEILYLSLGCETPAPGEGESAPPPSIELAPSPQGEGHGGESGERLNKSGSQSRSGSSLGKLGRAVMELINIGKRII